MCMKKDKQTRHLTEVIVFMLIVMTIDVLFQDYYLQLSHINHSGMLLVIMKPQQKYAAETLITPMSCSIDKHYHIIFKVCYSTSLAPYISSFL